MRVPAVVLTLFAVVAGGACAPPPPPVKVPPDVTRLLIADARVASGCYDCLLQAREIYEQVGAEAGRSVVLAALFETEVLIALREKELAMTGAATESIARARKLAGELPPEADAERYLALVEMVLPDNVGTPRAELSRLRAGQQGRLAGLDTELAWLRTSTTLREPARQYLSLAADCSNLARPRRQSALPSTAGVWAGSRIVLQAKEDVVPLVAYRAAVCDAIATRTLERVRTTVPQFAEAAFFLARPLVQGSGKDGGTQARAWLNEALARFPNSPSITYLTGNLNQIIGDYRRALDFYERTIAQRPLHEDALLGRTMTLTFLARHDEAIAQATQMIDLPTDNWSEGYYWRAFNYHTKGQLPTARRDIDRAKPMAGQNVARYFTLAGIIEHDQDDLGVAEADLRTALSAWESNCVALSYLGMVKLKKTEHLASAGYFSTASDCYWADVLNDERGLREMRAKTDLDPEFKARQIASFEAAVKEDRRQQYAAAFNAANEYAQGGNLEKARTLLDVAANEPTLADKVAQLRDILKGR